MYVVLKNDICAVRYVELAGSHLILRPHNHSCPVELVSIAEGKKPHDYLIGRICQFSLEA